VFPPNIGSGFKNIRFGQRSAFALQVVLKKRKLNIFPEVLTRLRAEMYVAQMVPVAARPASVYPRPLDKRVGQSRIEFINRVKCLERAREILRVVPSANHQYGALDVLHVPGKIARMPIVVVRGVRELIVEKRIRTI